MLINLLHVVHGMLSNAVLHSKLGSLGENNEILIEIARFPRAYISKYRLQNIGHFVQASVFELIDENIFLFLSSGALFT